METKEKQGTGCRKKENIKGHKSTNKKTKRIKRQKCAIVCCHKMENLDDTRRNRANKTPGR